MTVTNRKSKQALREARNIGPTYEQRATSTDSVLMVDRVLRGLLQNTIDQLIASPADLERFFSHFFDPTVGVKERQDFVTNFKRQPPKAILGYARSGVQTPVYAVVSESENESDSFLGDYVGQTTGARAPESQVDPASEFTGALFEATYGIYTYAEHPDVASYLWHLSKAIVHGGKKFLLSCGVLEVSLSGAELAPDANYMPDNMFVRVLRVHTKQAFTAPRVLLVDPNRFRMVGIHVDDINIDGIQGGVTPKAK